MPLQSAVHWLQKADLAREAAEKMSCDTAKTAMLEIAELYEHLAEQKVDSPVTSSRPAGAGRDLLNRRDRRNLSFSS